MGKSKKKDKTKKKAEHTMLCESGTAPCEDAAPLPEVTERTVVEQGIMLPWERWSTPPVIKDDGRNITPERPNPPVLEDSGEVFIPMSTLYGLSEQDRWASSFGSAFLLGPHEGLALEAAGLAERETKGGHHRTDRLMTWLGSLEGE